MLAGSNDIRGIGLDLPTPQRNAEATTFFVAVSAILMATTNVHIASTYLAILMVFLCLVILYCGRQGIVTRLVGQPMLVALPCFFVMSTLWSDSFFQTLSYSLQTLLTVLTAITIAQCTTSRQFLFIIFLAGALTCIGCILHGGQAPSATGPVFAGFLGSKNAMGLLASTATMASIAILFDARRSFKLRVFALAMAAVEGAIAVSVHATTAIICLAFCWFLYFFTLFILSRFRFTRLITCFVVVTFIAAMLLLSAEFIQLFVDFIGVEFNKDATLTGRTVLWQAGKDLFQSSPFLGHGFRSFWVGNSAAAVRLLNSMNIPDGRGFHFHQQYLETLVDTGVIGFVLLILTCTLFIAKIWKNMAKHPSSFTAFSFTIVVVYYIRWFLETALLPFSFDMMVLFGLAAAAMKIAANDKIRASNALLSEKQQLT